MRSPRLSVIPARAATDRSLQPRDLQVLCVLGRHTDDEGWCWPSQVKMAAEMGCARSTVQLAVERLVRAGYLDRHVRETENGRDTSHLYRVILDPVHPAIDTVPPVENLVDETGEEGGETPADTSAPLPTSRHPLPTLHRQGVPTHGSAPMNDSILTTHSNSRERARAQDEDRKIVERWLKRVHPQWPTHVADSTPKALQAALDLNEADREAAAARLGDYLETAKAGGRKHPCSFAVYLAERRWEKLPPPAEIPFNEFATPFSKAWSAWIIARLLTEPAEAEAGFPLVGALHAKAKVRQGAKFARRWHELGAALEPVPVGSDVCEAWRDEFERRGWPWWPDPGDHPVLFLPIGGVAGLAAFEAAIAAGQA